MKRFLTTFTCVLLCAALLVLVKNEYARLLPAGTYGMQAALDKGQIDNLFIGSSMFRQGLAIDKLEEELSGSSYILSYNGNQPALMAMELEYLLEEGLELKNVYIDLYPYTAAATPWISDTKILLDTDLDFKLKAWRLMALESNADFGDFYEFFVTSNMEQLLTWPVNNALVSAQFRDGGSTLESAGRTAEELDALGSLGARDGLQEAQMAGYRRIIELAEEYSLQLYFLETPKYARMYEDEDYLELYRACREELEKMAEEREGAISFTVITAEDLSFDTSEAACYQDLIHLSAQGRRLYTEELCRILK